MPDVHHVFEVSTHVPVAFPLVLVEELSDRGATAHETLHVHCIDLRSCHGMIRIVS